MQILSIPAVEWIGYLAMFTLLGSFLMKDLKKLRIVNSFACAFFVAYGFLLVTSWPIIISNSAIISINIYYLFIRKN